MQKAWKGRQELSGQEANSCKQKGRGYPVISPMRSQRKFKEAELSPPAFCKVLRGFRGIPRRGPAAPPNLPASPPGIGKRGGSFRPFWVSQKVQKGPGKTLQRFPRHLPLLNVPEGPPQLVLIGARRRSVHPPACRSSAPSPRPRTAGSSRQTRRRPPRPQRTAQGWPRSRRPPAGAGC